MSEIRVGDKVNINAEVLEISGNFCNDTATLLFDDGSTDYSLIKRSNSDDRIESLSAKLKLAGFQGLRRKLPVSVINIKGKKRKNNEIKVGDKVNINAEVLEICEFPYEDSVKLRLDNGFKIKAPISAISKDEDHKNEQIRLIRLHAVVRDIITMKDRDTIIYVDCINSKEIHCFNSHEINESTINLEEGDEVTIDCNIIEEDKSSYSHNSYIKGKTKKDQIINLHPEDCSYVTREKEDTDTPLKVAPVKIIKEFALQAGDIDFSCGRKELVDNNGISTVVGEIDDKEVCSHLYEDILLDPVDNKGNVDPDGKYVCLKIEYQFRLQEYEAYNPERTCPHCGHVFRLDFKSYILERNAFLDFCPVYKYTDERGRIGIFYGRSNSICATTEEIWDKYRFKDALEVYDKIYDTDWASKLDTKEGSIHE